MAARRRMGTEGAGSSDSGSWFWYVHQPADAALAGRKLRPQVPHLSLRGCNRAHQSSGVAFMPSIKVATATLGTGSASAPKTEGSQPR
jgi:hypothetical protein